jgi:DNA-binding NtrC family response regulator
MRDIPTAPRERLTPQPPARASVAVVDDDASIREAMVSVLEELGFAVEGFADAESAQAAQRQRVFDAFVVDWTLQRGTSEALLRGLVQCDARCTIFLLTGSLEVGGIPVDARLKTVLRMGQIEYRAKPYSAVRLAREIAARLGSERGGPAAQEFA